MRNLEKKEIKKKLKKLEKLESIQRNLGKFKEIHIN